MFCSRSFCTTYLGKRSILINDEQTGALKNNDSIYCLDEKFCYTCKTINNNACLITLETQYFPILSSFLHHKRSNEDVFIHKKTDILIVVKYNNKHSNLFLKN